MEYDIRKIIGDNKVDKWILELKYVMKEIDKLEMGSKFKEYIIDKYILFKFIDEEYDKKYNMKLTNALKKFKTQEIFNRKNNIESNDNMDDFWVI
ncbi:hypothetical protein MYSEV_159 [Mythimna separata entomopoxvirus 'L']|uniref:Uncharacterized protein n=1 Tax=Mythimna separata entomopoxvirus 'L' TaxID=1293572 RepID=A0A916KQ71_9POXV|nr:hypothetical protein MYSEV_159 [Mythimna separata entomopoxvirus 'L']CCU56357.1 hypothetical protein MYSEV_159 [Mythimna separata entomopoxvirus 'L']